MKFLFTTTDKLYSRLIRWGLEEDCSHFAIQFDLPTRSVIMESIIEKGVHRCDVEGFLKENKVIHSLEYVGDKYVDNLFYDCVYRHYNDRYDTTAIMFWALATAAKRTFHVKQPWYNPWDMDNKHYCVEVLDGSELLMAQYLGLDVSNVDWGMTSPHEAYDILRKSAMLIETP